MACITKRRDRWVIDFYDQFGQRQRKTLPLNTTKTRAREELRAIEEMVAKGTFLHEKKTPLFSQVAIDWLEYKKPNLRETTWEVCKGQVKNHFSDFDNLKINRITTAAIEKFINTRRKQGINIYTLRKILVTLGQIMAYAVRHKYIDYNPVREAERPRESGAELKGIKVLTPQEIQAFLNAVTDQKYKTLFMLAVMSGARQGELLGLKWSDLDLINNQINIQRTFTKGRFFDTKTRYSRRKIDLGPMVMLELKKWKLACLKSDLDLIFPNEAGGPTNYSNMVQRYYRKALKDAGISQIRFHDLRHTYCSLLLSQGENVKYIQTQMGHSSPTVTLNVYAHLMKGENQEAACRLENTIFEGTGHNLVTNEKKELTVNG